MELRRRDRLRADAALYPRQYPCLPARQGVCRLCRRGYPESQGAFAERVRQEVAARLGRPCRLELGVQTEFAEPAVRINADFVDAKALG